MNAPMFGDDRLPDHFWSKVIINETTNCWEWTASRNEWGYGKWWTGNKSARTHRVAYEALVGPIASGLCLDHLCRTRHCCNPTHLEPVTNRANLLRGVSFSALNAVKTHCPKGHEYTPENTWVSARNQRHCRTCDRLYQRAKRAAVRQRRSMREAS